MPYSYRHAYNEIQFGYNNKSAVILLLLSGFCNSNEFFEMSQRRMIKSKQ